MGYHSATSAIEARFQANWTADATTLRTPVRFGDARLWLTRVDGASSRLEPPVGAEWAWLTVLFGAGTVASLSSPTCLVRTVGLIQLSLFTPKGKGAGAMTTLADLAVPIFERQQFGGLNCFERQIAGSIPDAQWDGLLLRIPFDFDEASA